MNTKTVTHILSAICFGLSALAPAHAADPKPNILLIIADDMGYSDISCFGGEILSSTFYANSPNFSQSKKSSLNNFFVVSHSSCKGIFTLHFHDCFPYRVFKDAGKLHSTGGAREGSFARILKN